jgi:hypothetical protein
MPRYAILTHDHPFPHWDLLLEWGESCRTWRLLDAPACGATVRAQELPPHRLAYLDYEGPVSAGRGTVARWDAGEYAIEDAAELRLTLRGNRGLCGAALLAHAGDAVSWRFLER